MKYMLQYPGGVTYEFTLDEIQSEARRGRISDGCKVRRADSQQWQPVSALLGPCPSAKAECHVITGEQRQGPYLSEQLRSMWASGTLTAASAVIWEGQAEPVKLTALMDNPLFNRPDVPAGASTERKTIGAMLAVVGVILVLYAVMRLNSLESQFMRGMGKSDDLSTFLLVGGIPAALIGIYLFFAPPASK